MKKVNLQTLPKVSDCISFVYIEYARIEQEEFGIAVIQGKKKCFIPIASVNVLLLAPGTVITHAAVKTIAEAGCIIIWCRKDMNGFYTAGNGRTHSTENLMKQIKAHEDETLRTKMARAMYQIRFPDKDMSRFSIKQMMGAEGSRMYEAYQQNAEKYRAPWDGRNYKAEDWDEQSPINQALSSANSLLYDICHGIILALGLDPALGIIHSGNAESFVFDIADIYKDKITIPAAFQTVAENKNPETFDKELRINIRKNIVESKFMSRIIKDIKTLFNSIEIDITMPDSLKIWTPDNYMNAGINHKPQ